MIFQITHDDIQKTVGAIVTAWMVLQGTVTVLLYRMKRVEKDIDAIAEIVGTPKALARKLKREKNKGD